ncbi:Probable serine/threonine-protein kinase At1g54610 [Linum grandiflorum]
MGCIQSSKRRRRPPLAWCPSTLSNHEKQSTNLSNKNSKDDHLDVVKAAAEVAAVAGGRKAHRKGVLKKIGTDDYVDGWPKWLVDNIPKDVLAGLIGQGTYSNVYKARDRDSGKIVALKKVRFDTSEAESIKFMAREIMVLQKLDHPNIIKLEGIATSRMQYSLYLVFDYMQSDLTRIISRPSQRLTEPQVKCYMQQLLMGLEHCHERGILHRDIKGSNLLIDKNGMLKIADFGLANFFVPKPKRPLTTRVVTLWYRAPELLLGATDYGVGIDLWSAGCLLAEMFVGRPIMPGRTEVEQIHRIFKLCGSPAEDYWKIMRLPTSFRPPQHYKPSFHESFKDMPASSIALLTTLLSLNPSYRGTATSALQTQVQYSVNFLLKRKKSKKQATRQMNEANNMKQRPTTSKDDVDQSSKELEKMSEASTAHSQEDQTTTTSIFSQEATGGNSTSSSTSSNLKPVKEEEQEEERRDNHRLRHPSFSPVERRPQLRDRANQTEAHPNASKNIQNNFTLLQASVSDILNPRHSATAGGGGVNGGGMQNYRRSMSTLDFCALDPDKISKLFGLDDDHRGQLLHKSSFNM